jgi:malonyl-CoA O-methyltransferase
MINKEYKRKSFNRAATTYDSFAILQDTISNKLFDRLKKINLSPLEILDLGCGTGTNGVNLKKQYEKSRIINYDFSENMLSEARLKQKIFILNQINPSPYSYICGDIEAIPLKENSLDLVWSSSTLQWCNELDLVFNQVKKILKPGGLFIFSTFGPNTLNELREITENLFNEKRTSTFIDIKSIGATNGNISKAKGLSGRSFTKKIIEKYEEYRKNKLLPASYEVIYGHAWNIPKTISEYQQIKFKDG